MVGCSSVKKIAIETDLTRMINRSEIFQNELMGFSLYDPYLEKYILDINADKYFTPASNTKLLTLYASLKTLGDSIPTFAYTLRNDSLYLRSLGDPTFLHPDFIAQNTIRKLQLMNAKVIALCEPQFPIDAFGPGWAWDDYSYEFQPERSELPMYGNVVTALQSDTLTITPSFFSDFVELDTAINYTYRPSNFNVFNLSRKTDEEDSIKSLIPFKTSQELTRALLEDTTGLTVVASTYYGELEDTLFNGPTLPMQAIMMQRSDNFLAEQMLYMAAVQEKQSSIAGYIHRLKSSHLLFAPDSLVWVDGSGLSRYNLFTPRTFVSLIHKMYRSLSWEEIEVLFPRGGESGTIRNWYGDESPYVFAKTGTLRHNHCLSGFIKTRSGKTLIFSFMNNHFTRPVSEVKAEMQVLLENIRDAY